MALKSWKTMVELFRTFKNQEDNSMKCSNLASVGVAMLMAGCATQVATLPVTDRDAQVYSNPYIKADEGQKKDKQAIKVAVIGRNAQTPDPVAKQLSKEFGADLETAISNLADFQVVPRSELGAIISDTALANMTSDKPSDYKLANVDFLIIYDITSYSIEDKGKNILGGKNAPNLCQGVVKASVSLVNKVSNTREFTKSMVGSTRLCDQSVDPAQKMAILSEASARAVKDFVTQFAVDYAPPAVVQQTKGGGQVALLNLGKNYGLTPGMKMEFFTIKEKNGKRQSIPFAYGEVIELAEDTCWVEVDDFENAGVKENHYARVRTDQSKSFLASLANR